MNIAIDIRSLTDGRSSGVEEYTFNIIQALGRVAPQHTYHLFFNAAQPKHIPAFSRPFILRPFHYPNKLFNITQWLIKQPRWDRLVRADCFFLPALRLIPLAPTTPLVTTVHDVSFEHFPEFFSWRRRWWHMMMQPRSLLARSNHLIAVSQATATDVGQTYGITKERISVVHSGVPVSSALPGAQSIAAVRSKYQLPEHFVLYFGTLEPRKNIPSLITAFEAIADLVSHDLVIAGSPGWLMQPIREAQAKSRWRSRIHLIGFVDSNDKAALYRAADLFVYPSFFEGFGFPPLEALSVGTPVITSANSSLPEIVGQWAVLVDPYKPGELALLMAELLRDPQRLPPAVSQAVRERYSWDTAARQTIAIIEQAAYANRF